MKRKRKDGPGKQPSVEEFLSFVPKRGGYEWATDDKGLVHITVPKFYSSWGRKFCRLFRKKETFTADMDELGSLVWTHCDGAHTVKDILDTLKQRFGDEKDLDQRLFLFLQQMKALDYLTY